VVDSFPDSADSWVIETHQRNQIARGLTGCRADDVVIISDLDEIPNPDVIKNKLAGGIQSLKQKLYYGYLNGYLGDNWTLPKIMLYKDTLGSLDARDELYSTYLPRLNNQGTTPSKIRLFKAPVIADGGWHFGYLGGIDQIIYKIESYSHQENNTPEYKDPENLKKQIANIKYVEIDETFPEYIRNNRKKLSKFIHPLGNIE